MRSFDPMAAAIDWLDAYRAASLAIVDMYAADGALECACGGTKTMHGRAALTEYWRQRFSDKPASELMDLQIENGDIVVSYRVADEIVRAVLHFDDRGKISLSRCAPDDTPGR